MLALQETLILQVSVPKLSGSHFREREIRGRVLPVGAKRGEERRARPELALCVVGSHRRGNAATSQPT